MDSVTQAVCDWLQPITDRVRRGGGTLQENLFPEEPGGGSPEEPGGGSPDRRRFSREEVLQRSQEEVLQIGGGFPQRRRFSKGARRRFSREEEVLQRSQEEVLQRQWKLNLTFSMSEINVRAK